MFTFRKSTLTCFNISIIILNFNLTSSARILFIVTIPSLSHHLFYQPIIKELSLRSHQVLSITADPIKNPKLVNLTEIDVHNEAYGSLHIDAFLKESGSMNQVEQMGALATYFANVVDNCLAHTEVQKLIKNYEKEHFDLLIIETVTVSAFYAFRELYKCPMIGVHSLDIFPNIQDALGNPSNPAYHVDSLFPTNSDYGFWQRLKNFKYMLEFRFMYYENYIPKQEFLLRKYFGSQLKSVLELEKSVDLVLVNTNPIFNVPRPLVPNIISVGGLYREHQALPLELKNFLDRSNVGVIYFSLGSIVRSNNLPTDKLLMIIKAFKELPFKILWKWENATLDDCPNNVFIQTWLPQQEVLDHPNVKVFVTQGGIQSLGEAIKSKVPIIGIPFGGDQHYNTDRVANLGIGRQLFFYELTSEQFKNTILEVASNQDYQERINKISDLLYDQHTKPIDLAIWWIEYVLRHGGAQHLRTPGADLKWYEFYMADVIGFLVLALILILYLTYLFLKTMYRKIFQSKQHRKND